MAVDERPDMWWRAALDLAQVGVRAIEETLAGGELVVSDKVTHHDLVTEADHRSERAVVAAIAERFPDDAVLGEEFGSRPGTSGRRWVIDPVDGTVNFVHGRADHAVSVGLEYAGEYVAGAICRPAFGDWVAGQRGTGDATTAAWPTVVRGSSRPPALSGATDLGRSLVSFGFPHEPTARARVLEVLRDLTPRIRDFRRIGSAACDLFAVTTGALDATCGFWQHPWDVAGGWAIVRALGGEYRRFETKNGLQVCTAGNPAVVAQLVAAVGASTR